MTFISDLEESIIWKLNDLGINRFAIQYSPINPTKRILFSWFTFEECTEIYRDNFSNQFNLLAVNMGMDKLDYEWRKVDNEDWSISWKKGWKPDPIGDDLLVLPAWLNLPDEYSGRLIIRLDPGSAFGTGSHATTRLCLESLENSDVSNLLVADIGCGSGILTIAALRLGAKEVLAFDLDELAVRATNQNANLNNLRDDKLRVFNGSIDTLSSFLNGKTVDLLICNILAPVIEELAPSFNKVISDDGKALLSGVLLTQVKPLKIKLKNLGWRCNSFFEKDDWALLEIGKI